MSFNAEAVETRLEMEIGAQKPRPYQFGVHCIVAVSEEGTAAMAPDAKVNSNVHSSAATGLATAWRERLRGGLHDAANWTDEDGSGNKGTCSLLYCGSGVGFSGTVQEAEAFFVSSGLSASSHLFHATQLRRLDNRLSTLSLLTDDTTGRLSDEFLLTWTHQGGRDADWLFPRGVEADWELPTRRYSLVFTITAEAAWNVSGGWRLRSARVHWDQGSLLRQAGLLPVALQCLLRPQAVAAFDRLYSSLPLVPDCAQLLDELAGPLNTMHTILRQLPAADPACELTPRASRSRALNPALRSTLNLTDAVAASETFDSPLPERTRRLMRSKSSNHSLNPPFGHDDNGNENESSCILHGDSLPSNPLLVRNDSSHNNVFGIDPLPYRPQIAHPPAFPGNRSTVFDRRDSSSENSKDNEGFAGTRASMQNFASSIFEDDASATKEPANSTAPRDESVVRMIYESRVFDSVDPNCVAPTETRVAAAPAPLVSAAIVAPGDDIPNGTPGAAASHVRLGMNGHFTGSAPGCQDPNAVAGPVRPSFAPAPFFEKATAQTTDGPGLCNGLRRSRVDLNRSQIRFGDDDPADNGPNLAGPNGSTRPSSRVLQPPGGISTIQL